MAYTPQFLLMSAVRLGDIADVRAALEAGADVNKKLHGGPPLCLAVARGFVEIFELLVKHGAKTSGLFKDQDTGVPLTTVLGKGKYVMFKTILSTGTVKDKIRIDWKRYEGHILPLREDSEIVAMLEKLGTPLPPVSANEARAALIEASENGDLAQVLKILKQHPTAIQQSGYGNTPLHSAASKNHLEIVKALLAAGAPVDPADEEVPTPLWWAAEYGSVESLAVLLDHGANIDFPAPEEVSEFGGCTPLHVAIFFRHKKAALLLIQRGAALDLPGHEDRSALKLAEDQELPEVCEELRRRGMK